jgi:hypothetical protein
MKTKDLENLLLSLGIHKHDFGINEVKNGETWNIMNKDDKWEVFYSSRVRIGEKFLFESENDACQFMLNNLKKEFGIK